MTTEQYEQMAYAIGASDMSAGQKARDITGLMSQARHDRLAAAQQDVNRKYRFSNTLQRGSVVTVGPAGLHETINTDYPRKKVESRVVEPRMLT